MSKFFIYIAIILSSSIQSFGQGPEKRKFLFKSKFDTTMGGAHIELKEVLPKTDRLINSDIDDRDKISRSGYTRADAIQILGEYLTFQGDNTKSNKTYNFRAGYHPIPPADTAGFTIQMEALFSFTWMLTVWFPPIRPTLVNRATGESLNDNYEAINEVFSIYKKWYSEGKKTNFVLTTLPLEGTPYAWAGENRGMKDFFAPTFYEHLLKKE